MKPHRHAFQRRFVAAILIAMTLQFVGYLPSASAHELRPSLVSIILPDADQSASTEIRLRTNLEALIGEIGSNHDDTDDAPAAAEYDRLAALSPAALSAALTTYLPTLLDAISLQDSPTGTPVQLALIDSRIPEVGDPDVPRDSELVFSANLPPETTGITWQWHERYGPTIVRTDSSDDGSGAAAVALFSQYLQAGEQSDAVPLRHTSGSHGSTFVDYVVIGFEHIIPKGLDHILFVIALFLLSPRIRPIVWQVSMFTLAHTLTLALAITGVLNLPASIVEPLIALSIAAVCVENLLQRRMGRWRLVIVFVFGLLHGLGFAGVLGDIGLAPDAFVQSLLAFNIGVEIGQLTVVAGCFLIAGWPFGDKAWYRRLVTTPASLIIGATGLLWFVQRLPSV